MEFILNTESFIENDLTIKEGLILLSIYFSDPIYDRESLQKFQSRDLTIITEFLDGIPKKIELSYSGIELVESILMKSNVKKYNSDGEDYYVALAEKLKELFPKGRKEGTNLQWRDSTMIIATRLKTLVKKYNAVLEEDKVIEATQNYIKSFNGNYRYMQVLKYFIFKNVNNGEGVEQSSQLLAYMDNLGQDNVLRDDWNTTLR